jgi:hypothetical protein
MSRSRRPAANKKEATGGARNGNGGHNGNGGGRNKNAAKGGKDAKANRPGSHTDFWGTPASLSAAMAGSVDGAADAATAVPGIRPSKEPDTMVRSLGPPPLAGQEAIAEHYFAAVYEKAVGLAGALAAAGGLLEFDDPTD